jgi:hypothetical protein
MLGTISGIYQMIKSELTGIKRGHQLEKVDAFAAIQNN